MKKTISSGRGIRGQRGFSILEILIATVLISSLVASGLYYANVGDKSATAAITASKAAIAVRFPEAIMTIYALRQTLVGTTNAELVSTGSVQSNQPVTWGVASTPAPSANSLSISLTFDDSSTASSMRTYLTNNSDTMLVSTAAVDAGNGKILTVTYDLN